MLDMNPTFEGIPIPDSTWGPIEVRHIHGDDDVVYRAFQLPTPLQFMRAIRPPDLADWTGGYFSAPRLGADDSSWLIHNAGYPYFHSWTVRGFPGQWVVARSDGSPIVSEPIIEDDEHFRELYRLAEDPVDEALYAAPCGELLEVLANNDMSAKSLAVRLPNRVGDRIQAPPGFTIAGTQWHNGYIPVEWGAFRKNGECHARAKPGEWFVWVSPERYPKACRVLAHEDFIKWYRLCESADEVADPVVYEDVLHEIEEESIFEERGDLREVAMSQTLKHVQTATEKESLLALGLNRHRRNGSPIDSGDWVCYDGSMTDTLHEIPADPHGNDVFIIERRDGSGVKAKAIRISVATSDVRLVEVLGKRVLFERGDGGIFRVFIKSLGEAIDVLPGSWLVRYIGTNEATVIDRSVLSAYWRVAE